MNRFPRVITGCLAALGLLNTALTGCGGSDAAVNGSYVHDVTGARIELDSGKARFQLMGMRAEGTYKVRSSSVTIQLDWNENTFGTKKKATFDFECTRSKSETLECRDDDGGDVSFRKLM